MQPAVVSIPTIISNTQNLANFEITILRDQESFLHSVKSYIKIVLRTFELFLHYGLARTTNSG